MSNISYILVRPFNDWILTLIIRNLQAYLILAVVLGASIGHFVFGAYMDVDGVLAGAGAGKGMACH